ncbi:ATP-binding cassette sub-family C member 4-like [Pectinophora gossypiella]|uniref:ATP-binding cassette sub-family C member 4-like n=1 Tax=Pectinophora gossypiella TaxID=13191 RepID=UPI00214E0C32|nr:ATP-binding cassette sub-family C member 4-like [Pectinophora gossypiella]
MENGTSPNTKAEGAGKKKRKQPNIVSRWFLCWVCPVLFNGNRREVEESDLVSPPSKQYDSQIAGDKLERAWLAECEKALQENRKPSLWKALSKAYWLSFMPGGIYQIVVAIVRTIQPLLFAQLLSYWTVDSQLTALEAGYYALAMLGLNFIALMSQHHGSLFNLRFSMKMKVACSALLFRKLMRINQASIGDVAAGKLVNLLANDVARFDYAFMFLHHLWIIPIQVAAVLYFMWISAGYAPFVGFFGVVILIFPIQAALTRVTATIRRAVAQRTDRRIKLMGEIIGGIQVIKMYAWEKPFQKIVAATRAYELNALTKSIFVRSVFIGFMMFTERTILFVTCLTLILSGDMVTAPTIYPIQQYFSIIQMNVTLILPLAIASLSEMFVSLERIEGFMALDEREDCKLMPKSNLINNVTTFSSKKHSVDNAATVNPTKYSPTGEVSTATPQHKAAGADYSVELSGVSASWTDSKEQSEMTLKNISMRVRKGKMCAVIGPVGSGKSSLLQVLLKELPTSKGSCSVNGKISYASQDAWLFPATVRENILFGVPYDVERYKKVCKVCCLQPDFKQFPYGDLSLVGERGVSLSGGQRARINLARAVYREADIYLLDDPLSAVDANVGRELFEGCISEHLRGRTVILVTHQVHFLKSADQIVVLNEGSVENIGTYDELAKSGTEFSLILSNEGEADEVENAEKRPSLKHRISLQRGISVKSDDNPEEEREQIQVAEERASGTLKVEVLIQYLQSVQSWCLIAFVFIALITVQGFATTTDYWLSFWTNRVNEYMEENNGELPDTSLDFQVGPLTNGQYLGIYGGLVLSIIVFLLIRISIFVTMTMRASKNLHNTVFKNLIAAVMRFFDTNPSGRVLNRFSKDLGAMDEFLPRTFLETIQMYLLMTSILVLNALALPYTLIPTFVLVIIFFFLLRWYLNAAQAVKRLEGTTKSPVFGKINSTVTGLSTIRSSNAQDMLMRSFDEAQDLHSSAFYTFIGGSSALGMYLDAMCLIYLGIILAIFILVDFGDLIPVGSVGLAVSQSMVLTMTLQMSARFTADFLAQTTSVERVLEYTKLNKEQYIDDGPTKPPKDWPTQGNVKFEGVSMKYGEDDPPVLKNLNFEIQSGWKVGVVGRTGAGKSSLISALFRLYDIEGKVKIDGVDTHGVAKQELRSKISIIPQEPVLFSAPLRYNLDPFDSYSDDDIWRALEQVELKEAIPAIDFKVSEGGSNFSVGQRQLVCLARAILRSNKILVMDEATANVDPQTDALIQKTIRREFSACTVITIAHRLNTIMDSDRVLVMDKGEVAEFDHPYLLLSNPNSIFTFMVNETGPNMSKVLIEMAKNKYLSTHPEEDKKAR